MLRHDTHTNEYKLIRRRRVTCNLWQVAIRTSLALLPAVGLLPQGLLPAFGLLSRDLLPAVGLLPQDLLPAVGRYPRTFNQQSTPTPCNVEDDTPVPKKDLQHSACRGNRSSWTQWLTWCQWCHSLLGQLCITFLLPLQHILVHLSLWTYPSISLLSNELRIPCNLTWDPLHNHLCLQHKHHQLNPLCLQHHQLNHLCLQHHLLPHKRVMMMTMSTSLLSYYALLSQLCLS